MGGRTYRGQNDLWRLQGFLAYGFRDDKFKYGISGKWLLDKKNRVIVSGGNRRDVEQIGASLTSSTDVLGRSLASSSVIGTGANNKLTNVNLSTVALEAELFTNLVTRISGTYKTLRSASEALSPSFSLDYYTDASKSEIKSGIKQFETAISLAYYPKREMTGFGVERRIKNSDFSKFFAQIAIGNSSLIASDFNYKKIQFSYLKPWSLGGLGRLTTSIEIGKTFGEVPLALLSVIPGNQSYFSIYNTFSNLDYYEFVTDEYATLHLEHNFNGRLFSRLPFLKKQNLRAIVGLRGVIGDVSNKNRSINASFIPYVAPNKEPYYEYSVGVGNIFKVFRLDVNFRGNYLTSEYYTEIRRVGVTGSFGFQF